MALLLSSPFPLGQGLTNERGGLGEGHYEFVLLSQVSIDMQNQGRKGAVSHTVGENLERKIC